MRPRLADPRVGFFPTEYTQFESDRGTAQEKKTLIARFRLEKKANPQAAVSDPVKPITFYIGPGMPERWRPYVAAGVRQWLPVFEAAGFSNAIRAVDAPTPQQDPNWSAEDVTLNVIRWVPEERANAMGPHVIDPRSGETLSAHVLIWPGVIDTFGQYYWAMFGGGVDPAATRLPLSQEKSGAILSYIVAHEVGHTLGLMHNHMASTAHTVAQLRNPAFANKAGPNSSIMAYGRFNHVAQPGDGVTQLWGVVGPYDYAAIRYGYADFGSDPPPSAARWPAWPKASWPTGACSGAPRSRVSSSTALAATRVCRPKTSVPSVSRPRGWGWPTCCARSSDWTPPPPATPNSTRRPTPCCCRGTPGC
jgi:hypothetical protein